MASFIKGEPSSRHWCSTLLLFCIIYFQELSLEFYCWKNISLNSFFLNLHGIRLGHHTNAASCAGLEILVYYIIITKQGIFLLVNSCLNLNFSCSNTSWIWKLRRINNNSLVWILMTLCENHQIIALHYTVGLGFLFWKTKLS